MTVGPSVLGDEAPEDAGQRGPIAVAEPGEVGLLVGPALAVEVGEEGAALRGEPDASGAAVLGVGLARHELARLEGIIPALEPSHAIAWALANPGAEGYDVICLSGRGDKDLAEALEGLERLDG